MKETTSNDRIVVSLLGSGWAAVHIIDVTDDNGTYTDIQQTGIGRYKTREEAITEAKQWAQNDEIKLAIDD